MDYTEEINAIRSAMENNNLVKADFYNDASGCYFLIRNNVTHDTRGISLPISETFKALAGFRLQQHKLIHCF